MQRRLAEVDYDADKLDEMEAKDRIAYNEATGEPSELDDLGGEGTFEGHGAGAFKVSYGLEGEMTGLSYPDGLEAAYAYNSVGDATALSYTKHGGSCSGAECEWFSETIVPSIHGEAAVDDSSLSDDTASYNALGQLIEATERPAGEGCTTQLYSYSEEGDRASLTTRKPQSDGDCASEGGTEELHAYDTAGDLVDEGVSYEPLGNITTLPADDAGGHELQTSYYADGQAASQTQNGITNAYTLDPEGRTMETTSEDSETHARAAVLSHYAGPGEGEPAWTYDETTGAWSRYIAGFGGLLATEEQGKEAVLQLQDLDGDIIGTAGLSEAESKPLSMERSTTFGVPVSEKPVDKYNWLGASGLSASLPSGAVVQDGRTYVPQLGASLQTEAATVAAVDNVVAAPVVITMAPPTDCKYEEGVLPTEEAATPEGEIPSIDPEGIATGEKALAIAAWLWEQSKAAQNAANNEAGELPEIVALMEEGAKADQSTAGLFEKCYNEVHTPRKIVKHNGPISETHYVTSVCYYKLTFRPLLGLALVTTAKVGTCSDRPELGIKSEWYCEADKEWWRFKKK